MLTDDQKSFLGKGWCFPPSFNIFSLENTLVSDAKDIKQSLEILFSTRPGERIMLPQYGCDLDQYLFRDIDATMKHDMIETIQLAIIKFEPRIDVSEIDVDFGNYLDGYVIIRIDYFIRQQNSRHNIVFPFYLREGTYVNVG